MKRTMKTLLVLLVALALLSLGSVAALGETVAITYVSAQGRTQMPMNCTVVTSSEFATWSEGWYAVTESGVKISGGTGDTPSVTVSGKVNLILCDGASLETHNGLYVPKGSSLTIWAQSTGNDMGKLIAGYHKSSTSAGFNAGIGGVNGKVAGAIIINGGDISAKVVYGAGIGGGYGENSGYTSIEINGGKVVAYGNDNGAGIGPGRTNQTIGRITITGGSVDAQGSGAFAAIGSPESGAKVVITGGKVDAGPGFHGSGYGIAAGTITISADTAVEGDYIKAIGNKSGIRGEKITITGGNIEASIEEDGKGCGINIPEGSSNALTISGGTIIATGGGGAGIGTFGEENFKGTITISGGTVTASSYTNAAGIGSSLNKDFEGTVTISGGNVNATGGNKAAGIGGGYGGNARNGHIIITGGVVTAKGGTQAAGIGGGSEDGARGGEGCGDVQILGGTVIAQSGEGRCSAIGHGDNDEYYGNITFADNMRVRAGWNQSETEASEPFPWDSRALACMYRWYAIVEPCDHPWPMVNGLPVFPADSILPRSHRRAECKYCCTTFEQEEHDFDDAGVCMICGYCENGFRVSFDANGAEGGMEDIFIASGRALVLPKCFFTPPQNTSFIGWKIGDVIYQAGDPVTIDSDKIAVAQWSAPLIVTLVPGEGSGEPISVETSLGEEYPLPVYTDCNFTEPEWHFFTGWAVNGDETDLKQPLDTLTIADNTTVTAIWERPEYAITFDSNGGSAVSNQHALRGAHAFRPDDPTLEGYAFKDWYLDDEPFDFENTPIAGDITLTAVWLNPWETLQARIDAAADGETIALDDDVTAEAVDEAITIPAGKAITLDLAGHTLSRGLTEAVEDGNAITVNGSLTVNDSGTGGAITGGFNHGSGGGVLVANGGALTLNGGAITGNRADGSNAVPANGGGVYIRNGGSFTMNGGTITNNTTQQNVADCHGGGVYVSGSFTLNGGTVGQNTALTNGGGVYVADSTFAMTGGAITDGNWGYQGGGVYIAGGTFAMTGGAITGNKATYYGGGVNYSGGALTLSGNPVIQGNTGRWDAVNNLYLAAGCAVTVNGALTSAQPIGVTMETTGPFTGGLSGNGTASSFASDDDIYMVGVNGDGEAYLDRAVTVTFDTDGGSDVASQKIITGAIPVRPDDPIREGFTLREWQKDGSAYGFDTPITEDTTLKAVYHTAWSLLQKQIDEADDGATVALSGPVTAGAEDAALTIPAGKTITLDLAGYTLSRGLTEAKANGNVITVNGSLIVKDSGEGGKITGGYNLSEGGGIILDGESLVIRGGSVTGNASADRGGGVYMESANGSFTMNGGSIADNTSSSDGGGVAVLDGSFTMNGGSVSGNMAENDGNGGGVYFASGESVFTMKEGAVIRDNNADYGGGVYINEGSFKMEGGGITGNEATRGGGLYVDEDAMSVNITGGITGNTADGFGGGIYTENDIAVTESKITDNTAGGNGGGVYVGSDFEYSTLTLTNSQINNNKATEAYDGGGGVFVGEYCSLVMNGGSITGNTTSANGGGICAIYRADSVTVQSGNIGDNKADGDGGGVYCDANTLDITGSSITGNEAGYGGGVYAMDCKFTMAGGSISGNTATTDGGGVAVEGDTFVLTGGSVTGNTAGYDGGGVAVRSSGSFTMTDGRASDGSATSGSITDNEAREFGGGVWVSDAATNVNLSGNAAIADNTAGGKSSGIYLETGKVITVTGELTNATPIGIAMQTPGVFTGGLPGNGAAANFTSDDGTLIIVGTDSGELSLAEKPDFGTPDFTLPAGITLIEEYAFEGIDAHVVYIPDGCAEIGPYAFKDCKSLTRVRIPSGCAIGEFAFEGCENLYIFSVSGGGAEQYCAHHDNCTFVAEQ